MSHQGAIHGIGWSTTTYGRVFSRIFFLLLGTLFLPVEAQAAPSIPPAGVWFADHRFLYRIDPSTDQIDHRVELTHEATALAVDPTDGAVWLLTPQHLLKFDQGANLLRDVDLRSLGSSNETGRLDEPKYLLLNPHDTSLWIAGEKGLIHLDAAGRVTQSVRMPETIRGLALDMDESLWLISGKQLLHLSSTGTVLLRSDIRGLTGEPHYLAVDRLGNRLWVADKQQLLQFDVANVSQPLQRIALANAAGNKDTSESHAEGKISALGVHPVFGTVWAVSRQTLFIYDRAGKEIKQVSLATQDLGEIEMLAFDPVQFGLWLGGDKALGHLRSTGEFVARIPVGHELEALGVAPFRLLPTLSLLAPVDGVLTNNAYTRVRYGLGADCTGTPCRLDPDYTQSFQMQVDHNGLAIGSLFNLTADEALYLPVQRLPEGVNRFIAQATDRYGHRSEKITHGFTVDTIPPRFVSVSPADGSTVISGAVTIQGSVDDATASVMLVDAAGTVISQGGAQFAFGVILRQGWNVFTLVARDAAGNQASASLRLFLNTLDATLTDPLPDATVRTDSLGLSGTFKGPANTGITVNGIAAFTDGQHFYINNLPLNPGANTLTIVVTGPDGQSLTKTVTVTSSGATPLKVEVTPQVGLAPTTSRFTITYSGSGSVAGYTLDADGDGVVDDAGSDISLPREHTYATPGVYRPRITLTDSTGKTYDQTLTVLVQDPAQVDAFFTTLWEGMNAALARGDLPAALGYLNTSAKNKYQPVFDALRPNLAQIVVTYSPLARLSASESIGEYAISRPYQGQTRIYLIYFLKDVDGVWRVDEM